MRQFLVVIAFAVTLVEGEVPSKTYLPPPSQGYPQGLPEVIAARSLDRNGKQGNNQGIRQGQDRQNGGVEDNAFGRASFQNRGVIQQGPQTRFTNEENDVGYDQNSRNVLGGYRDSANYNYGYKVGENGGDFGHQESSRDEEARGQYHVVLPDGRKQTVSYEANQRGFNPQISYEDSDVGRSGYSGNGNNYGNHGYRGNEQNGARSSARNDEYKN